MNSHKIGSKNRKNATFKYISLFLFGILFALMATQAFTIVTGIENAVQYVKQIVLTSSGTAGSNTGIIIDGPSSKIRTTNICDSEGNNCKIISTLVTGGQLNNFLTGGSINTLATSELDCSNQEIPKRNGGSRTCATDINIDTDKYLSGAYFNTGDGIITLYGSGGQDNIILNLDGRYRTGTDIFQKNGTKIYYNLGNIGIGTDNPEELLHIAGNVKVDGLIKLRLEGMGTQQTCNSTITGAITYSTMEGSPCFCNGTNRKKFTDNTQCDFGY